MRLHEDKEAFESIVLTVANRESIRPDVLEKDYYVALVLAELTEKQAVEEGKADICEGRALTTTALKRELGYHIK